MGGIAGNLNSGSNINKCTNRGEVTGTGCNNTSDCLGPVGGIVGQINTKRTSNITNCKNYSTVNGKYRYVGGVCRSI